MITVIDYNCGNIASVKNAIERLGFKCAISSNPAEILSAKGVIFPGQGRAASALKELKRSKIDIIIPKIKVPFLGICLGMQMFADFSEEDNIKCLSIIKGRCRKFPKNLSTPQIGWNKVSFVRNSPLIKGIKNDSYFYFAHSYYFDCLEKYIVGKTAYGFDFPAIIQKDNFYLTQFHPEKSGEDGSLLLKNFCKLCL